MYSKVCNIQLKETIIKSLQNNKICNDTINVTLTYLYSNHETQSIHFF